MSLARIRCLVLALAGAALSGCVLSSYHGDQYASTRQVDVFYDRAAIPHAYTDMGTIRTTAEPEMPLAAIRAELVNQGRRRGADAIVIDRVLLETIGYRPDADSDQSGPVAPADQPGARPIRERVVTAQLLKYDR